MKEFKMKLTVDSSGATKEIEGTISTINEFETQLSSLQDQLNKTKIGTDEYKKLQKEIKRTEDGLENVKNAGKGWLDTIASAPGLVGTFGQSLQGVGKAFGNIGMAIKTSLIGLLATIIAKVIEKLTQFDGVMDPINKIMAIFSATVGKLANAILPAVAAVIEVVADGIGRLANLFTSATSSGKGYGDVIGDIADRTNDLDDAQAQYELNLAKSNRTLAEAREIAGDTTKSLEERKNAVLEAARIEEEVAEEGKRIALERARLMAQQMAVDMNLTTQEIENLKMADAARLESFVKQQLQNKALNGEKKDALLQQLAQIEQISQQSAQIGKKTNQQLKALDNEAAAAAKEASQKALEAKKNELNAKIELEKNSATTSEEELRKLLEQKDKLENQGTKKSKAELELQKQNREKAIQDALKADKDAKKTELENQKKLEDEKLKVIKQGNDLSIKTKEANLNFIKSLYGEESEAFKNAQIEINKARQKALQDELNFIKAKKELSEEDKARLKEIQVESTNLFATVIQQGKDEIQKKKDKAKEEADLKKSNDEADFQYQFEKASKNFDQQRTLLDEKEARDKETYDKEISQANLTAEQKRQIELNYTKTKDENAKAREDINQKEYEQQIAIAQGVANALGALSELVGKDTLAGKALGISQALINTYVGASEVLKAKAVLPEPANTIVKIVNVATTIATGLKTVREITAVKVPTEDVPEVRIRKQQGGILKGPLHQQGGIMTPYGELEGGEYVINRASTMMFRPQLDRINALGGGQVDLTQSVLSGNINQTSEPPIIKTYVVAQDMSSQQELDRVIRDRSKI